MTVITDITELIGNTPLLRLKNFDVPEGVAVCWLSVFLCDRPGHETNALTEQPITHNLPSRWSGRFIGRSFDMEAIRQWMLSPSPVCLITGWAGMGKTTVTLEAAYSCVGDTSDWPAFNSIIGVALIGKD